MNIPLSKRLKKKVHTETAMLQDEIVEIFYSLCGGCEPVLHEGTAIWRCYNGNRFSEDLDFYANVHRDFDKEFADELKSRGLALIKYKKSSKVVFSKISNGKVEVRLEISIRKAPEKVLRMYEKTNGAYIDVYTLSPESLLIEKMSAYKDRRFVRDIYDIYHLSNYVDKIPGISEFLAKIERPIDEENLRVLVYSGVAPSFQSMVEALKRRFL